MIKGYLTRFLFNRWAAFLHDLFWVPATLFLAFWFRFNLQEIPAEYLDGFYRLLPLSLLVHAVIFRLFGLYRGIWRYASLPDLIRIVKAVLLGALIVNLFAFIFFRLQGIPRTVLLLSPLFLIIGLAGTRLCYRLLKDRKLRLNKQEGVRTLVAGAGQAAELLLRDLLHKPEFQPVALVDDDPRKYKRELHGVRVYGSLDRIEEVVRLYEIELVLLAIPSADPATIKKLVGECSRIGVRCKTLPSLAELSGDTVQAEQLRAVTLEDLLGRDAVELDYRAIANYLEGKSVLVTGAGGSIGSELCRQIGAQQPSRLIILDHGEFNIYTIDHELRSSFPELKIATVLGDVKNPERVDWLFKEFSPQVVFHAAAYKHVPMIELNPAEGVVNNVSGSRVVADAAHLYRSEAFVLVSTDKAVNPANVMGTTKRIAEIYCQNLAKRSQTRFITTRFGNVLGSAGSVVPLFEKQIQAGGPVTVTHPDITRYFMTIPESVGLILQAGAMGRGGEIFVLDMGEPMLIRELAEQMIRLSGLVPGRDIEIIYTGLRPGEKLFEEIFHERENLQKTNHPKLFLASSREVDWQWLQEELAALHRSASSRDISALIEHLRQIVPEYQGDHLSGRF
ncbi:MAG: nucleoside-diphosphate sugar epimerase/dehydratase [Desulfurivibrionaceae bacterium]|nr:nucleoside-diphosphate sugar epimerase/dehydratase [Desulfurivibrionaceae bacterium]